ncbi:MAG: hypothetical protein A3F72_18635 [Bacteroidetes bacterium RIFCSPLOWO2_12_FULL_35_15]|nr:MAG: hypothetical protein A3F72_18635 [Bacteroidetes bacterium RIFCSPLOWO2_12_FULL_35_15]
MRKLLYLFLCTFSPILYGQSFTKLSIKIGPNISGQIKTPPEFIDGGLKGGFSATIEPTIFTFGSKKQFDFNTDFSFLQKGGHINSQIVAYDQYGQIVGIGSEGYDVTINYLSVSPTFKANFWNILFIKVGPRLDVFTNYSSQSRYSAYPNSKSDFNTLTYGITYGAGICMGKNKVKFILELVGQNDFSNSSYNKASGQTYKNYSYIINFGVSISLKKKDQ